MNLTSVQEMVCVEPRLSMVTALNCYDEYELSDGKDDCHIDNVVEEDDKVIQ
jgi:hypothetical protein